MHFVCLNPFLTMKTHGPGYKKKWFIVIRYIYTKFALYLRVIFLLHDDYPNYLNACYLQQCPQKLPHADCWYEKVNCASSYIGREGARGSGGTNPLILNLDTRER
jgi:hypothetical protein